MGGFQLWPIFNDAFGLKASFNCILQKLKPEHLPAAPVGYYGMCRPTETEEEETLINSEQINFAGPSWQQIFPPGVGIVAVLSGTRPWTSCDVMAHIRSSAEPPGFVSGSN